MGRWGKWVAVFKRMNLGWRLFSPLFCYPTRKKVVFSRTNIVLFLITIVFSRINIGMFVTNIVFSQRNISMFVTNIVFSQRNIVLFVANIVFSQRNISMFVTNIVFSQRNISLFVREKSLFLAGTCLALMVEAFYRERKGMAIKQNGRVREEHGR
jgi:hypothetical protein